MAGKMASISEGNSNISYFEGFTEEDLVDNISVVSDSDPDSSDIEVSSVGSSDISDLGEPEDGTLNIANNDVNIPQGTCQIKGGLTACTLSYPIQT